MEVSDNTQYSEQEYWDQRYETGAFDCDMR